MKYPCRRIYLYGLLLLTAVFLMGCSKETTSANPSFFDVIQTERSQVTGISVEYLGVTVPLEADSVDWILNSFESAAFVEQLEEDPFTESEYIMSIETADSSKVYPICWFNAKSFDENGKITGYADRRFDVKVDGSWYVFRQDAETYWNEDSMEIHYKKAAREAGIRYPERYKLEGFDGETNVCTSGSSGIGYPVTKATAQSIVQEADILILASFIDYEYVLTNSSDPERYNRMFKVQVEEVIKGEEIPETILIEPIEGTDAKILDGRRYVSYAYREAPDLKSDTLYLLSLSKNDMNGIYYMEDEVSATAVVQNGITYPRYNTEYHPFYKQNLEELLSTSSR